MLTVAVATRGLAEKGGKSDSESRRPKGVREASSKEAHNVEYLSSLGDNLQSTDFESERVVQG